MLVCQHHGASDGCCRVEENCPRTRRPLDAVAGVDGAPSITTGQRDRAAGSGQAECAVHARQGRARHVTRTSRWYLPNNHLPIRHQLGAKKNRRFGQRESSKHTSRDVIKCVCLKRIQKNCTFFMRKIALKFVHIESCVATLQLCTHLISVNDILPSIPASHNCPAITKAYACASRRAASRRVWRAANTNARHFFARWRRRHRRCTSGRRRARPTPRNSRLHSRSASHSAL